MEYLKIKNPATGIEIELEGRCWDEILELSYKRKKAGLFQILKKKTELLEKREFRESRVDYKNKKW